MVRYGLLVGSPDEGICTSQVEDIGGCGFGVATGEDDFGVR
jgi:hypothetical protein